MRHLEPTRPPIGVPAFLGLMSVADARPHDADSQRRKSELICKVLEDDAQIRERLSGQLVHIWRLIEGDQRVARINTAYGASGE